MIIFLYGLDTYRSGQKFNEIIDHYKKIHKSGLNLKFFDPEGKPSASYGAGGENSDFQDFKNEVETTSMFREKKLIVLKEIFSNQSFKAEFLRRKEKFLEPDKIILIYEKKEIPKNDSLFQFLKKNSKSQEFKLLEGEKLKNWVRKEFLNYKVEITPEALELLIRYVGNNLWQMSNEVKKLVNYTNGPASAKASAGKQRIKMKDVELLVKPKIETDIFKTIDALAERKKALALNLIHQHLEKGESPLYLLAMIIFQFRNLLIIKDLMEKQRPYYSILKTIPLHPFVVKKSYQQANKFTLQELKKIYQKIFEVDLVIKTGEIEPGTALDLLIAEI